MLEDWKNLGKSSNGKVEVSIWKKILSERGLAFADPAILDRWKIRKMGDWNVVAKKTFLNRGLFRQDDNSIYLA
jgi:hypothetical protein